MSLALVFMSGSWRFNCKSMDTSRIVVGGNITYFWVQLWN